MSSCWLDGRAATAACVGCGRGLCDEHQVRRTGVATDVFGPLFDDRRPRCDDCYGLRFWNGASALVALFGALIALFRLLLGDWLGVIAGLVIAVVGGGAAQLRAGTFRRLAARARDRRDAP